MRAYKLMRLKSNGNLGSLFVDRKNDLPIGVWMVAEEIPTKTLKLRKGWHCTLTPHAPHLKRNLSNGEHRVWVEVSVSDYRYEKRSQLQGGVWVLANEMKILRILK